MRRGCFPDGDEYLRLADWLRLTHTYTLDGRTPTSYRPPLYPALLAALSTISADPVAAVLVLQLPARRAHGHDVLSHRAPCLRPPRRARRRDHARAGAGDGAVQFGSPDRNGLHFSARGRHVRVDARAHDPHRRLLRRRNSDACDPAAVRRRTRPGGPRARPADRSPWVPPDRGDHVSGDRAMDRAQLRPGWTRDRRGRRLGRRPAGRYSRDSPGLEPVGSDRHRPRSRL